VRFAFPDEFTGLARKLHDRLTEKHDKDTDEGRALRALREIRVHASPDWNSETVALYFWFVRHDEQDAFEGKAWPTLVDGWLRLVPALGRFTNIDGQIVTLDEMTGADYVASDPLDLDHLSSRSSQWNSGSPTRSPTA